VSQLVKCQAEPGTAAGLRARWPERPQGRSISSLVWCGMLVYVLSMPPSAPADAYVRNGAHSASSASQAGVALPHAFSLGLDGISATLVPW
jgi:hypothetical protein